MRVSDVSIFLEFYFSQIQTSSTPGTGLKTHHRVFTPSKWEEKAFLKRTEFRHTGYRRVPRIRCCNWPCNRCPGTERPFPQNVAHSWWVWQTDLLFWSRQTETCCKQAILVQAVCRHWISCRWAQLWFTWFYIRPCHVQGYEEWYCLHCSFCQSVNLSISDVWRRQIHQMYRFHHSVSTQ